VERCEVCGFAWDSVDVGEVQDRLLEGVIAFERVLGGDEDDLLRRRPEATVWSALEYAAHVRDVLLHVRDRIVIALVEDDPSFKPLYRDQRVDLGLYEADDPSTVSDELDVAAALFIRTLRQLSPDQLVRTAEYTYPVPATRSILWMGAQALHELEHHLDDARASLRAVSG
jgi:S-DNA-T family DNA segregation ATPase FtsK/SpoIIIE